MNRRRVWILSFLCMLLIGCMALAEEMPEIPKFRNVAVHDPSIIRAEDGMFYVYGSHMQAARSSDLITWELFSKNAEKGCRLVENVQEEMKEALSYARTQTFWAPDVQQLADGRYYMYYCTCEGTSPLAALGLAVSDHPEGPYRNLGIFLKSGMPGYDATVYPNVIDPHTFFDKEGRLWMVYGSYSGGIYILEMNPETGFPLEGQDYGKKLLGKNHARIEGPYILYSPDTDYYYLFLSFGGLEATDGYNIRVCRSKNPDGPYEDALGQAMIECGGSDGSYFNDPDYEGYGVKLMGGYKFEALETDAKKNVASYRSPGHNSAYYEEETGRYFLIFHTRFGGSSSNRYAIRVHQMYMNEAGWPVVSPLRYAGEMPAPVEESAQAGLYKVLLHERDINTSEHISKLITLEPDGTVTGDMTGSWRCKDGVHAAITLDGISYTGVMHTACDADQGVWSTCLTALDDAGAALWAIRACVQPE